MSKGKKLAILLAVVVVLVGGYVAATVLFREKDTDAQAEEEKETIAVQALQEDEIVGIQYNVGDEVITLRKDGDIWHMDADADFPVEQSIPDQIASDAAKLTARRLVSTNPEDFAEYGLDTPSTAYVFTKADGTKVTYFIGNYNNFGGTYYMNVGGTNEIYLIEGDFLEDFDAGAAKLADVADIETASTDQVQELTLTLDGKTTHVLYAENGLESAYSGTINWFVGENTPADTVQTHDFIGKVVSYATAGCAAYRASKGQITAFGLDTPVLHLSLRYNVTEEKDTGKKDEDGIAITESVTTPESLALSVGKQSGDGTYYAKLDGSDTVYLLEPDYVDTLRAFDVSALRAADVCKLSSDEVNSMDVTIGGKKHTIKLERGDNGTVKYLLDGTQITAVQFNDFFASVQSAVSEGFASKKTEEDEVLRIVYHTDRKGFETMTLTVSPYDRNLYAASLNGGDSVLLDKAVFEKMQSTFEALL